MKIQVKPSHVKRRMSLQYSLWLQENKGKIFTATLHNINYYKITDSDAPMKLVHIYDAIEIAP